MTALDQALESDRSRSDLPRGRRRWLWITSGVLVGVVVAVGTVTAAFQFSLPWWMREGDRNHVYESDAGSLRYQVHLPPRYEGTTQLPVIMAIHGCGMTGYGWNSMKATTQFNSLANGEGFIVVYPTQRMFRSAINCWNPADPWEQHRYSGEPALLAGVARQVVEEYDADPARVHVAGASSGAGTAVILAATYPDVFATATSVAGGEYGLNQVDPDDPDSTPPEYTARQATHAPPSLRRTVRLSSSRTSSRIWGTPGRALPETAPTQITPVPTPAPLLGISPGATQSHSRSGHRDSAGFSPDVHL